MPYPFSNGDVLTASDLNTYAGLVFIKQQTIGSGVASVTVTDVFSSTFYSYRIVLSSILLSTNDVIQFTFQSQVSNMFGNRLEMVNTSTAVTVIASGGTGTAYAEVGKGGSSRQGFSTFDVHAPNIVRRKGIHGTYYAVGRNGTFGYENNVTSSYTGFVLTPGSGTWSGGEIFVYGYNNG